jgi:osmotically-inducible protein OsmY
MKHNAKRATVALALVTCILAGASATAAGADDPGSNKPISDSYITTKIKAVLTKDSDTKAKDIHVKTTNGVVSLRGTARSEAEKAKAEQDARGVQGVTDVHNDLAIRQPS